jgi:hypothetical protein
MNQESNEKLTQPSVLPAAWVEKIFATMLAHYGSRFADMWRDADIAMVKAVWAEKLGGFRDRSDCLKYGLDCLDGREWPPTLPEFISDCRRAPAPKVRALEHKLSPEDIERNRERARKISEALGRKLAA